MARTRKVRAPLVLGVNASLTRGAALARPISGGPDWNGDGMRYTSTLVDDRRPARGVVALREVIGTMSARGRIGRVRLGPALGCDSSEAVATGWIGSAWDWRRAPDR